MRFVAPSMLSALVAENGLKSLVMGPVGLLSMVSTAELAEEEALEELLEVLLELGAEPFVAEGELAPHAARPRASAHSTLAVAPVFRNPCL